mmetsp:Transcript_46821/g.56275  ORF Transcript_46821/g.56275 Transcript_46821/m.56275 type:complete len:320 (-) Transcript_46821:141-1100(-)
MKKRNQKNHITYPLKSKIIVDQSSTNMFRKLLMPRNKNTQYFVSFSVLVLCILLASPMFLQLSNAQQSTGCGSCQNGGICKHDENEDNQSIATCKCPKPYRGDHCEVAVCDNGNQCQNSATCTFNEESLEYRCDCSSTTSTTYSYAGLTCEHESTDSCVYDKSMSKITFCTNGGICKQHIEGDTDPSHKGCICPDEFEGPHCEYLKGTAPSYVFEAHPKDAEEFLLNEFNEDKNNRPKRGEQGAEHDIFTVVVGTAVLCVLGVIYPFLLIYHRRLSIGFDKVDTNDRSDISLDPDGGRLPDIHLDEHDAKLDDCSGELI